MYVRKLNIEFKFKNSGIMNSGKDILKLVREEQDGVFIHLLKNTNKKTIDSVFKKLAQCFRDFTPAWKNLDKCINITIMSLKQKKIIWCQLKKNDLNNLDDFFLVSNIQNINLFENPNWKLIDLKEEFDKLKHSKRL